MGAKAMEKNWSTRVTLIFLAFVFFGGLEGRQPLANAVELAKVNGKSVTDAQVNLALGSLNEGQRKSVLKDPSTRRQILSGLIDQEILGQEAEKQKVDQDLSVKEGLEAIRKQYLANVLLERRLKDQFTDKNVKKYFEAHKDIYSTDVVRAYHILLNTEQEAKDMIEKASKPDADFQALAEKNSKDPSAKSNRGDLGFFGRDRMVKEFTDAAFNAKVGTIVGPVKTTYGYHVIKVIERKSGKVMPFEDVEMRVRTDYRQQLVKNIVAEYKKSAKIQVDDAALNALSP
jgi:peptidyl-prolyl cis-trans isomerase C